MSNNANQRSFGTDEEVLQEDTFNRVVSYYFLLLKPKDYYSRSMYYTLLDF